MISIAPRRRKTCDSSKRSFGMQTPRLFTAVGVLALLELAAICDQSKYREAAEKTLRLFAERLHQLPQAMPLMLHALDFFLEEPRRVVIAGDPGKGAKLLHAAHSVYQPNK